MTDTATERWKLDQLGTYGEELRTEVTREALAAYARATNSPIAAQLAGDVAPPVYAIVPPTGQMFAEVGAIVPPSIAMRVVHGEQDMRFHRPIVPGMTLVTRAAAVGVHAVSSGVTLHVHIESRDGDGAPVNDQSLVVFFRGAEGDLDEGERAAPHGTAPEEREEPPAAVVEQHFDADQTFRYSEASGDLMPIHLDDEIARSVGLPGIIIHGLCAMAFNANAVIEHCCGGDTARLRRLAVRFSKPNFPDTTMRTTIWRRTGEAGGYAFESTDPEGALVIRDGLAEVASA